MRRNQLYYSLKPYVPWRLRIAARRFLAWRKLKHCQAVWPINPAAAAPPPGWRGWPDNKRFAVVLTHDVEGVDGLESCLELMRLEMELGFRSSFNFIPEGSYRVSATLRQELKRNGFEVGVHDLRHDGKLYQSHRSFSATAEKINRYLKEWGAVGFRSGFMLHNLEWIGQLDIQYDASTFDTDPFEPQTDGANTIFPFWVEHGVRGGYVELPYTLPQDSTMFIVLQEPTNEIWRRKVEWIANAGGMVLLNVHPDYLKFKTGPKAARTQVREHYRALLSWLKTTYRDSFWQPLPCEMAEFVRLTAPNLTYAR